MVAPDKPRVGYGTDRPRKQSKKRYVEPPTKPEATTGGRECSPEQRRVFWDRRDAGFSVRAASKYANFSYSTGLRLNEREQFLHVPTEVADQDILKAPRRVDRLPEEAKRAREDFAYFQRRYFGRIAIPWQVEAAQEVIKWLETEDEEYLVVNAPPGCLAGDTIVTVNRGGNGVARPISEVVRMWNGGVSSGRVWDPSIVMRVARAEGDVAMSGVVTGAWESGVKETFTLTTDSGRSIRATADHPFQLVSGEFRRLGNLDIGDEVRVNVGQGSGRPPEPRKRYASVYTRFHPHQRKAKDGFRYWKHRLVMEASLNGLAYEDYIDALRHDETRCKEFTFLARTTHVHHIDEDHTNNELWNLAAMDGTAHLRHHANPKHVLYHIGTERIASIVPHDAEMTYDLAVADDPHNFLANGFVVHNSGKSTMFTLDLAAFVTCRNRAIRGLIGSRTATQAKWYTGRLRRALERTQPERAELMQARLGLAVDAETTMARDFGRFKPMDRDLWTTDSFIVMQESGVAISEKEPTWSSFGMDSGFLGGRFDIVIWDDVVDPSKTRTVEQVDYQRSWWDDVSETRLEPGGLLILQGQRIGAEDLYRYNLDKTVPDFIDDDSVTFDDEETDIAGHKKYHHIMFKAHYEDRCKGAETHKPSAAPYPEGCLLYPRRLGWKKLATHMQNNRERFRVLYQQEDSDPADALVSADWVWGRGDFPGCVDKDRDRLDLPDNAGHMVSVVSCDPSPTNNWAIEWWVYNPVNEFRYLVDLYRGRLDAPGFLDFNLASHSFTGVMEDWQARSVQLGARITHWIVEINAAQRFLLQYDHFLRWKEKWGVEVIPHTTSRNKGDADYGVTTLAPHYQFGRVRLPGKGEGLIRSMRLIDEVTRYQTNGSPNRSDDCVMAEWFFEWQLPNIKNPRRIVTAQKRPSWLVKAS